MDRHRRDPSAIGLIEKRLRDAFAGVEFKTHGVPQDLEGARNLAARGRDDKNYYFEFEKWALSLIAAQPCYLSKKAPASASTATCFAPS